jgi:protein-disulfide isomerase
MENDKKGFFDGMPSKTSFIFGLVSGVALISLLTSFGLLSGNNLFAKTTDTGTGAVAVANAQPSAAAPTAKTKAPTGEVPEVTDADHIRGDKNAPVTFVEYSDFECPFCKKFAPTVDQILEEYDGEVRVVYRHYPLSFHANAQKEAEASECANELGGNDVFWQYHDAIFDRGEAGGTGFALTDLVPLAEELGLNGTKFKECLDSGKYTEHVKDDMNGGAAAGVTGTPGSFIIDANGDAELVSGALPFVQIKTLLDAALAK